MIDLRSDTVTRPSDEMRQAMYRADVGDDVFGDDPTVLELQEMLADKVGMEAGLFVPSGTQSNLLALMSHCERGDEYIVGQTAHTYRYEAGGAAVLGSIQPQPIPVEDDGTLSLGLVESFIKPDDSHFARTKLLCIENTQGGRALPMTYLEDARFFADKHGLALHLDGARVFNAAAKHGVDVGEITRHVDTVSVCLSKGLGAPIGSVLCGSSDFIARARRWRKMVGGGMRQVGILAAAGIYALDHNVARLGDDHENAAALAMGLSTIEGVEVQASHTNMVFLGVSPDHVVGLQAFADEHNVLLRVAESTRLVTHLDVTALDVERVVQVFATYFAQAAQ